MTLPNSSLGSMTPLALSRPLRIEKRRRRVSSAYVASVGCVRAEARRSSAPRQLIPPSVLAIKKRLNYHMFTSNRPTQYSQVIPTSDGAKSDTVNKNECEVRFSAPRQAPNPQTAAFPRTTCRKSLGTRSADQSSCRAARRRAQRLRLPWRDHIAWGSPFPAFARA